MVWVAHNKTTLPCTIWNLQVLGLLFRHPRLHTNDVKDVSKGDVKRTDDGLYVIGGTQIRNVKRSDDSPSIVESTQLGIRYANVVSKR